MKITTKGRYTVTAMLDLAIHQDQGPIALADISERQGISLSYLEQLFARLRRHALVKSARGPGGGYRLGRAADSISVAQIIRAVDESMDATKCGGRKNCQGNQRCLSHHLWEDLSHQVFEFLDRITLADVIRRRPAQQVAERQDAQVVTFKAPQPKEFAQDQHNTGEL